MNRISVLLRCLVLIGGLSVFPVRAQAQSLPPSFAACAACHTPDGKNSIGPSLKGVYGRKAGSVGDFTYSKAMKNAGIVWDDKSLNAFIENPQTVIPGNLMPFSGLPDPVARDEIVKHLNTWK